ncbi:hypothetical protein ACP70R_010620 [Stipagrostis hirtigluma subsp. patula]
MDYGIDFDDDKNPVKAFQCLCGSRSEGKLLQNDL